MLIGISRKSLRPLLLLASLVCPTLNSSPVLSPGDLVQCGCNNSALQVAAPREEHLTELTLTGFFSFNSAEESRCSDRPSSTFTTGHLLPAALVALDEINGSPDILPGYHLSLDVRENRCDPVHTTAEFVDSVLVSDRPSFSLGVLTDECGTVAEVLGGLSSRSLYLPVMSYGLNIHMPEVAESVLRGSGDLSSLFRLSRSTFLAMESAIGLMSYFHWTGNVAFASQDNTDVFLSIIESVVLTDPVTGDIMLSGDNVTISVEEYTNFDVRRNGLAAPKSVRTFFERMRSGNIRVVLGLVSQKLAAQLICAGQLGTIPGDGFVYVFVGSFSDNWWVSETESCILTKADVQSVIVVSGSLINQNSSSEVMSGRSVHDFKVEYVERLQTWCDDSAFKVSTIDLAAGLVYDAVWSVALAANSTGALLDDAVGRSPHYDREFSQAVLEALEQVIFNGVTGSVRFSGGERVGFESVQQIQDGDQIQVGWFSDGTLIRDPSQDFVWRGSKNTTVPSAEAVEVFKSVEAYWWVLGAMFSIAGLVFALVMWVLNWRYSRHRILLASSQKLNYIIIVGVMAAYVNVLILTVQESPLGFLASNEVFKALCLLRLWLLPLAFTLTYGVLFARAWRIYRVFNNPWATRRPYKDVHLMLMVLVAAVIDAVILLPWSIVDPYRRFPNPSEVDYDSFSRCVFLGCESDNLFIWLLGLATYKVSFLLSGIIIISLVRRQVIARKIYDDTRSLTVAAYITALGFILGVPLTFLFVSINKVELSYIVGSLWVNISSSGTLICVFIPKFYRIIVKKDTGRNYRSARRLYYQASLSTITKARSQSFDRALDCTLDRTLDRHTLSPGHTLSPERSFDVGAVECKFSDRTLSGSTSPVTSQDGTDL